MTQAVTGWSSMATRALLTELAAGLELRHGIEVGFRSAGGVEVAQLVRDGAAADLVVLAADALDALESDGLLAPGTVRPLFVSQVVAAVPSGRAVAPLSTVDDLRAAVLGARRVGYSTGPSGSAVLALLERWGLRDAVQDCLVQATPGVSVGSLLASGRADLGFQQLSELRDVPGVRVLGPLPGAAAVSSTFSGAVLARSAQPERAARALVLMSTEEVAATVAAHAMTLVSG